MADHGYPVMVLAAPEQDGGGFIAIAPDLPGCFSAGDTREEAVADLSAAIEEWIDEANRLNRPVPRPFAARQRAMEEHSKIHELVRKQDEILQTEDMRLHDVRQEMRQLKESISELINAESSAHNPGHIFRLWQDVGLVSHESPRLAPTGLNH